jgi:hypothetical protein
MMAGEVLARIGPWLRARGEGQSSPPRFSLKFCGGCNPTIERGIVAQRLREGLEGKVRWVSEGEKRDFILIINGCPTACADTIEARGGGAAIVISGEWISS